MAELFLSFVEAVYGWQLISDHVAEFALSAAFIGALIGGLIGAASSNSKDDGAGFLLGALVGFAATYLAVRVTFAALVPLATGALLRLLGLPNVLSYLIFGPICIFVFFFDWYDTKFMVFLALVVLIVATLLAEGLLGHLKHSGVSASAIVFCGFFTAASFFRAALVPESGIQNMGGVQVDARYRRPFASDLAALFIGQQKVDEIYAERKVAAKAKEAMRRASVPVEIREQQETAARSEAARAKLESDWHLVHRTSEYRLIRDLQVKSEDGAALVLREGSLLRRAGVVDARTVAVVAVVNSEEYVIHLNVDQLTVNASAHR